MNLPHSREHYGAVKGSTEERPELYNMANVAALIPHLSVTLFSLLYCTAVPPRSEKGPFDGGT